MAGQTADIRVTGLVDLNAALLLCSRDVRVGLRAELATIGAPVARSAEALSVSRIRNMSRSVEWSAMRVGQTPHTVYVAPRQRGRRFGNRKRPNLAPLMLSRAMIPALQLHEQQIEDKTEAFLHRVAADFNG